MYFSMSEINLDNMFTHIEVLKSREPEINQHTVMKCPFDDMSQNVAEIKNNTPSSLVHTICMKKYKETPIIEEKTIEDDEFFCKYTVHGMTGEGVAANKRNAKQLAARNLLLTFVDSGRHAEFLIPGETADDAKNYINSLTTNLESDTESWFAKCHLLCQARKIKIPQFEFDEVNEGSTKMFRCRVMFDEFIKLGKGRTKKAAQNSAFKEVYQEMINRLDQNSATVVPRAQIGKEIADGLTVEQLVAYLDRVVNKEFPKTDEDYANGNYEAALDVLSRFVRPDGTKLFTEYKFHDELARTGVLVSLEMNGLSDTFPYVVNGGMGPTEKIAREQAAWKTLRSINNWGRLKPSALKELELYSSNDLEASLENK